MLLDLYYSDHPYNINILAPESPKKIAAASVGLQHLPTSLAEGVLARNSNTKSHQGHSFFYIVVVYKTLVAEIWKRKMTLKDFNEKMA